MKVFLGCILCLILFSGQSYADKSIVFGPESAKIEGSIKYTVLGRYTARFNNFKGNIVLDEKYQKVRSVFLEIGVRSLNSRHAWYDKVAKSRRLLNAKRYPKIIFKSDKIVQDKEGLEVKGILQMHGIKRRMMFPFIMRSIVDSGGRPQWIAIKGRWNINRKDFNIIWNKYLDHGGVIVSDIFTVDWSINLPVMRDST